jgi:hypothetical protein
MNFLEAIFSFVFGDGDPNETFEERRWRALGQHIQVRDKGGTGGVPGATPLREGKKLVGAAHPGEGSWVAQGNASCARSHADVVTPSSTSLCHTTSMLTTFGLVG